MLHIVKSIYKLIKIIMISKITFIITTRSK